MKCVPGCLFCLSQELTPPLCFGKFFLIFVQQYCQRRESPFFLPFFSHPFPHPFPPLASTVSSPTVLLPSTHKILELSVRGKNGPFCPFFHSQIKYHDCTVVFSELWIVLLSSPCCIRKRYHSSRQSFTTKLAFLV